VIAGASTTGESRAGLPWPVGDPGALAGAASALGSGADTLRSTALRLRGEAAAAADWQGQAASAFRAAVGAEHAAMTRGVAALEHAAAALRRLSTTVREAQELVERLAAEVVEAEEEAERAAARAALASAASIAAGAAVSLIGDAGPALQAAADDAADDAAVASSAAGDAAARAREVRERATRLAQDACDQVLREDRATAAALDRAEADAPLAGVPVGSPTPATTFGRTALADLTLDQWRAIAYWRAGIDGDSWRPEDGLFTNDEIVQAVYRYYGNLYLEHPELQWAGMANIVGPMFYAGWQDMYAIRGLSDDGQRARYLSELVGLPTLPSVAYDAADHLSVLPGGFLNPANLAEHLTNEELEWYEDRFLGMQREIFDDLAWQHEAFLLGGVPLMREIGSRYPSDLTQRDLDAWEDIGSGDPERVSTGNRELLLREQKRVIQNDYDAMREHHGPVGDLFTYGFSAMADNPIPGGQAYRDYDPIVLGGEWDTPEVPIGPLGPFGPHLDWDPPDVGAHVTLPLPAGNLSNFDDRWGWIENDMLPHYQELLRDPDATRTLVSTPVADRAGDFRKLPDLPYPGG
jgi:uncharacterized protein YukE